MKIILPGENFKNISRDSIYLRPLFKKLLKLKGYISKKLLLRLLFAIVLAASAWMFDYYHKGDGKLHDEIARSQSQKQAESFLFYYNPANHASLKLQVPRPSFRKVFFESENKFLVLHHSLRAYHFFKAEPLFIHLPLWLTQHHLIFSYHFSDSPDELPARA